ncbi:hypothetical protein GCM10009760_32890 [Kitasatospora kazusensis]|uniref:Peptidase M48 domain-containing protein n=1 Tax=Kitasatospora kazusensis TaxID=407974 RepID=A0ABN2ZNH8_9ACTN
MHRPSAAQAVDCPSCGSSLDVDERFPAWCPGCEWNLSPAAGPAPHRTPRQQRGHLRAARRRAAREALVRARVEKLYESLTEDPARRHDANWFGAAAIAGAVHLLTLAVFTGSVLLVCDDRWPVRVLGVIGVVVAVLLRPRLGRVRNDANALRRDEAPALYALADRVAAAVGGKPVDVIRVTGAFNASFGRLGLLRRSELTLGLQLWTVLTPQQRVALLGHEFGHGVNGDSRRGLWLDSALRTLSTLHTMLLPDRRGSQRGAMVLFALVAGVAQGLVCRLIRVVLRLLHRLTSRSGQRAEYRADILAAELASTEAARGMLETLLLEQSVQTVRLRLRATPRPRRTGGSGTQPPAVDFWTTLAEQVADVPPLERERLRRLSARDLGAVDVSHPPTHLRMQLLDQRPKGLPSLELGDAETTAIEAELAPARKRLAAALLG